MRAFHMSILALASLATARIIEMSAPAIIAPNEKATITLKAKKEHDIKDVSVGLFLRTNIPYSGVFMGRQIAAFALDQPSPKYSIDLDVTMPGDIEGTSYISAMVNSLHGEDDEFTYTLNVAVTPGQKTSAERHFDTNDLAERLEPPGVPDMTEMTTIPAASITENETEMWSSQMSSTSELDSKQTVEHMQTLAVLAFSRAQVLVANIKQGEPSAGTGSSGTAERHTS